MEYHQSTLILRLLLDADSDRNVAFDQQYSEASDCGERSEPQSALKIVLVAIANIKLLEDSFQNNNHSYTGDRYKNLDLFICNNKS